MMKAGVWALVLLFLIALGYGIAANNAWPALAVLGVIAALLVTYMAVGFWRMTFHT